MVEKLYKPKQIGSNTFHYQSKTMSSAFTTKQRPYSNLKCNQVLMGPSRQKTYVGEKRRKQRNTLTCKLFITISFNALKK